MTGEPEAVAASKPLADGEGVKSSMLPEKVVRGIEMTDGTGIRRYEIQDEAVKRFGSNETNSHRFFFFSQTMEAQGTG